MADAPEKSTADRLGDALAAIPGCPPEMVTVARFGYYDEYQSPLALPLVQLISDLGVLARSPGITPGARRKIADLIAGVKLGRFDCTEAEADAWAASPEGQEAMRDLGPAADAEALFRILFPNAKLPEPPATGAA